jgi:hypothetical protein
LDNKDVFNIFHIFNLSNRNKTATATHAGLYHVDSVVAHGVCGFQHIDLTLSIRLVQQIL